jgi:hypothetical protein
MQNKDFISSEHTNSFQGTIVFKHPVQKAPIERETYIIIITNSTRTWTWNKWVKLSIECYRFIYFTIIQLTTSEYAFLGQTLSVGLQESSLRDVLFPAMKISNTRKFQATFIQTIIGLFNARTCTCVSINVKFAFLGATQKRQYIQASRGVRILDPSTSIV